MGKNSKQTNHGWPQRSEALQLRSFVSNAEGWRSLRSPSTTGGAARQYKRVVIIRHQAFSVGQTCGS